MFPSLPVPNGDVMIWSFIHSTQHHPSILKDMLNKNNYCWENQVGKDIFRYRTTTTLKGTHYDYLINPELIVFCFVQYFPMIGAQRDSFLDDVHFPAFEHLVL
jgi:hypothetical protein